MKKIFLSFIFIPIIAGQVAWGQIYHPFPDSNAVWNVLEFYPLGSSWNDSVWNNTMHYGLFGDTLINSHNYNKLFYNNGFTDSTIELSSPNSIYYGAIREETPTKKIYYMPKDSVNESLLYDFDLNLHDTITLTGGNVLSCNDIDSILLINNHYRKVYYIWNISWMIGDLWIEGIGSKYGLLYTYYYPILDTIKYGLLCFHQNDTLAYQMDGSLNYWPIPASLYNNGCYHQDFIITTNILNNANSHNPHVFIYPNPVIDKSVFEIPDNFSLKNILIEFYNSQGKMIKKINIIDGNDIYINASEFSAGLYFFKIINGYNIYTAKFIVQ